MQTAPSAVAMSHAPRGAWIQSPVYDLAFFLLSPILGFGYLAVAYSGVEHAHGVALYGVALIAIPHYLSTFTFYAWEENRERHRRRWVTFFAAPVVLALFVVTLLLTKQFAIHQLLIYFWNAYHVSRQSSGIVSIYRHRAGVRGDDHRRAAGRAILGVNAACTAFGLRYHPPVRELLASVHGIVPDLLLAASIAFAVVSVSGLVVSLGRRSRSGEPIGAPELLALTVGLLLFHPLLWVDDAYKAAVAVLLGHFTQYLGLVWLLHRRKFGDVGESGSDSESLPERPGESGEAGATGAPRWLRLVSSRTSLLVAACVGVWALFTLAKEASRAAGIPLGYEVPFVAMNYLHFYLDGRFWSFRDPVVRSSIAPVLFNPR